MRYKIQRTEVFRPDDGEDRLTEVVSQAGDEARRRKQEAMSKHYAKIRTVVAQAAARNKGRVTA